MYPKVNFSTIFPIKFMFFKKATKIDKIFTADLTVPRFYVGTQGKKRGSNNRVNQGDLVVLKGRKIRYNYKLR